VAVSAALVEECKIEGVLKQVPIYFVSEALNGSKLLYSEMEKMAYVVVMAARKPRYYFQSYKVTMPTSYPLRDIFENREASGRIRKWASQLAEHTISFNLCSAIKSQMLADFIADWTPSSPSQQRPTTEVIWHLACDEAYYDKGAGASAVLVAPSGINLKYTVRLDSEGCTNNIAEYERLVIRPSESKSIRSSEAIC
jgi:hypothetical protein